MAQGSLGEAELDCLTPYHQHFQNMAQETKVCPCGCPSVPRWESTRNTSVPLPIPLYETFSAMLLVALGTALHRAGTRGQTRRVDAKGRVGFHCPPPALGRGPVDALEQLLAGPLAPAGSFLGCGGPLGSPDCRRSRRLRTLRVAELAWPGRVRLWGPLGRRHACLMRRGVNVMHGPGGSHLVRVAPFATER